MQSTVWCVEATGAADLSNQKRDHGAVKIGADDRGFPDGATGGNPDTVWRRDPFGN